jgi:tRNA G37 N-methylase TrmD
VSGHHGRIAAWRAEQGRELTRARRPDLLEAPTDDGSGSSGRG